ncbi:type 1 glutamine amidotransferase domain-containing protein [Brachybacterium endophyticum]|uniref:Type 1 glutamine amidotransferase domain-containing protein n=1 Tax=Brachybacterium endophyticum TaxID=2182385 RepID=A0A2U2RND6_9MICO|nr:type 1 glutamine amidotransferase domain-containing protein [Brachybacterium endophyticum]PWH07380.1 type 1 glutamine amidotransferase domain-containing protein [Brachybacterium endophyticum]
MTSVLMVLSGADHWTLKDGTEHPSGVWAEEFVTPYEAFRDQGYDVTVATPGGVKPTIDQLSLGVSGGLPRTTRRIAERLASLQFVLDAPADLHEVDPDDFDLLFYSGGHGPMEDLAYDAADGQILTRRLEAGKPLALLCHAPAAMLAAKGADGAWPFAGYRMTGLSNTEERVNPFAWKAKWWLETRLKEKGARFSAGLPLLPHVVEDRALLTGQNPQSSQRLADRAIEMLGR